MATIKFNSGIMKRILFIFMLFVSVGLSAQQYFFNGTVHVPKTTAQINAISSPVEGRQEANSDTNTMWYYDGTQWVDTGVGGGTDDQTASEVPITDSGNNYTGTEVETALSEIADSLGVKVNINPNSSPVEVFRGTYAEAQVEYGVDPNTWPEKLFGIIPDYPETAISLDDLSDVTKGSPAANSSGTLRVLADPNEDGDYNEIDWTPPGGGNVIPVTQAEYDLLTPTEISDNDYAIVDESSAVSPVSSGDSGTTGLVLEGSTGGTYTIASQSWSWSRSGNSVVFKIEINSIDGSTPTGVTQINLSGTSFPRPTSSYNSLIISNNFPVSFYSFVSTIGMSGLEPVVKFYLQTSLDGSNNVIQQNLDFTGTTSLVISGSYITND